MSCFFGSADRAFTDEFVLPVGADTELIAVALAVLFRPTCVDVFLVTLGGCPIDWGNALI